MSNEKETDVPRYRKKPVEIEAIQWTGSNQAEIADFMGTSPVFEDAPDGSARGDAVRLRTIHGDDAWARPGDWIIPEIAAGRFYPCKRAVFEATYEEI